eukprot:TRINITY_DN510_c0_g1_i1.p1 TRINITY_DN510_c0_g1~~TRINITY_DN510_c0_g1_i1.p1  ORF type:complete len:414 (+),score=105.93 TRINITY_DN510_c0_g1_i1:1315-2556(+)
MSSTKKKEEKTDKEKEKKKTEKTDKKERDKKKEKSTTKHREKEGEGEKKKEHSKKSTTSTSTTTTGEKKEKKEKKEKDPNAPPKTPDEILKSEYRKWKKNNTKPIGIELVSLNTEEFNINFRFTDGVTFSVTYPESFPNARDEPFFVISTSDNMDTWNDNMQEYSEKQLSLSKLLAKCVETYEHIKGTNYDFGEYGTGGLDDDGFGFKEEKKESKNFDAIDAQFADKKFLEIGSPAASLRLIKDLKSIKRADPALLGFTAEPRVEPGKNMENLYHWLVKLRFDGQLGRDLQEAQKKFGIEAVELEMRFSESYPFKPPFVRVVRPRFQFLTGHVTIGGSICMELLTNSGWRSTNDIESILIQIRAEMQEGNARLDLSNTSQYSESEAWDAFYRAARNHGWDIKDIGPTMFPTIK